MSITTTYKCDKCGCEQAGREQFWTLQVTYACGQDYYGGSPSKVGKGMDVCRPCLESFGICDRRPAEVKAENPPPSLEDLIREIVRSELPQ